MIRKSTRTLSRELPYVMSSDVQTKKLTLVPHKVTD